MTKKLNSSKPLQVAINHQLLQTMSRQLVELVARGQSLIYHAPELGPLRTGLSRQTVNQILVVAL